MTKTEQKVKKTCLGMQKVLEHNFSKTLPQIFFKCCHGNDNYRSKLIAL